MQAKITSLAPVLGGGFHSVKGKVGAPMSGVCGCTMKKALLDQLQDRRQLGWKSRQDRKDNG